MSIPTDQQLIFLRQVVISAFTEYPDDQNERRTYISNEADVIFSSMSDTQRQRLIRMFSSIQNLTEARNEINIAMQLHENELKQRELNQAALLQQQHPIPLSQEDKNRKRRAANISSLRDLLIHNSLQDLDQALETPLQFKIPTATDYYIELFPDIFEEENSQIASLIDVFLFSILHGTSETATSIFNANWVSIVRRLIPSFEIFLNQSDESSNLHLRPDVAMYLNGAIFMKGEEKAPGKNLYLPENELVDKLNPDAWRLFPEGSNFILGFASSGTIINIYKIQHGDTGVYGVMLIKNFNLDTLSEKVDFLVFLMKFCRFVVQIKKPNKCFHLVPGIRTKTRNGHHVTWTREGLEKEYCTLRSDHQMEYIAEVYNANLPHLEHGYVKSVELKTTVATRVGRLLSSCISDRTISKEKAVQDIRLAVQELHDLGYAHCDISLDNCFVDTSGSEPTAFLDDLEYIRPLKEAPTNDHNHRLLPGVECPLTSGELDEEQLKTFELQIFHA